MSKHIFECIDAHTCGNPVRLILTEKPDLEGISMSEKRLDFLIQNLDYVNTKISEPQKVEKSNFLSLLFGSLT